MDEIDSKKNKCSKEPPVKLNVGTVNPGVSNDEIREGILNIIDTHLAGQVKRFNF